MATGASGKRVLFKLVTIGTDEFSAFRLNERFESKKIDFSCNLLFMVDKEQRHLGIQLNAHFKFNDEPAMKLVSHVVFEFEQSAWGSMYTDKGLLIKKRLAQHLAVIAVGTARGILHARTEGTPHARFILPLVNVQEMVVKDLLMDE